MATMSGKIAEAKAWLRRRTDNGVTPNADEVWRYINSRWPSLAEEDRERIYERMGY